MKPVVLRLRLLVLSLALFLSAPSLSAEPVRLVFGVLNQQSPIKTAERWNPILAHITAVTGLSLQMKMGPTVPDTNAMMARGDFDLVFTNHNFRPEYDGVYRVIAKWSAEPIQGVIAVAADSPAASLKDLEGKRIAFPSEYAFIAYAVPLAELKHRGIKFTQVLAGNQDGALAQLKAQQVDAVAVNSRFLTKYAEAMKLSYRMLYVSENYPDLAVIAHPRLPKAQVEAVREALIWMKDDPKGAAVLEAVRAPGFVAASESEYASTRRAYRVNTK